MQETYSVKSSQTHVIVNEFIRSVYNWMGIGLALTGFIAYFVSNNAQIQNLIFGNKLVFFGLIIAELALVYIISARVNKIQASTATSLFILYAALNGATLASLFLVYTSSS
ncbi:MAG: Bax inhibitor-1 family protein, partial [Spirochaetota bacterium]